MALSADQIAGWVQAAAASTITGVFTWLATRPRAKTRGEQNLDAVNALSEALDQLRSENERLIVAANGVRSDGHKVRNKLTKLHAYVQTLLHPYITDLRDRLLAAGIEAPPPPPSPDFGD